MDYLIEAWLKSGIITQLLTIIMFVFLLLIGVIQIPFIKIKLPSNKRCNVSNCHYIAKYINTWKIKTQETIYEQLSLAENTNDNITMYMIDLFGELTTDLIDIEHYTEIVTILEYEIRGKQKKWFKENHFTEKSDEIFRIYIEDRNKDILHIVSTTLNRKSSLFKVNRELLMEHNTKYLIPYAIKEFTKMFYAIREISRKQEAKIKAIEQSMA